MTKSLERRLQQRIPQTLKLAVEFKGVVFRNSPQRYATEQGVISTAGSRMVGGRYNVPHEFGVLYLSCDVHTCTEELEFAARNEGAKVEEKLPRTFTGIKVELEKVLDLTDAGVRRKLGITKKVLVETNWLKENSEGKEATTQVIGRVAKGAGFEALLVPSARWPGMNLNLLLDEGHLSTKVSIIKGRRLRMKRRAATRERKAKTTRDRAI